MIGLVGEKRMAPIGNRRGASIKLAGIILSAVWGSAVFAEQSVDFPESAGTERAAKATVRILWNPKPNYSCRLVQSSGDRDADQSACAKAAAKNGADGQPQTVDVWIFPPPPTGYIAARPLKMRGINMDDYPDQSLKKREFGRVVTKLTIGETGKVEACAILESSGFERLDAVSCSVPLHRFEFVPASIDNKPVRSAKVHTTTFTLPQGY